MPIVGFYFRFRATADIAGFATGLARSKMTQGRHLPAGCKSENPPPGCVVFVTPTNFLQIRKSTSSERRTHRCTAITNITAGSATCSTTLEECAAAGFSQGFQAHLFECRGIDAYDRSGPCAPRERAATRLFHLLVAQAFAVALGARGDWLWPEPAKEQDRRLV
jgi:hypothetical protein